MDERAALDARLDALARMLPPWLARLRDPAQFWPQFRALARGIVGAAPSSERGHALRRLAAMIEAHAHELPPPVPRRFVAVDMRQRGGAVNAARDGTPQPEVRAPRPR